MTKRNIILNYIKRHKEITGIDVTYAELSIIFDIPPDELMTMLNSDKE